MSNISRGRLTSQSLRRCRYSYGYSGQFSLSILFYCHFQNWNNTLHLLTLIPKFFVTSLSFISWRYLFPRKEQIMITLVKQNCVVNKIWNTKSTRRKCLKQPVTCAGRRLNLKTLRSGKFRIPNTLLFKNYTSCRFGTKIRELKKNTTATVTAMPLNKRFNEQNNGCARALCFLVHFFVVPCKPLHIRWRWRERRRVKIVFLFYFGISHLFGTIQCVCR